MGYATTTSGHVPVVRKTSDKRVVRAMLIGTWYAVLNQSIDTTEETWRGLSLSDAQGLCVSSESSTLSGAARAYLGGAVALSDSSAAASWMRCDSCWGTKITSTLSKMGDSNLYQVTRVTTVYDVTAPTGVLQKL